MFLVNFYAANININVLISNICNIKRKIILCAITAKAGRETPVSRPSVRLIGVVFSLFQ